MDGFSPRSPALSRTPLHPPSSAIPGQCRTHQAHQPHQPAKPPPRQPIHGVSRFRASMAAAAPHNKSSTPIPVPRPLAHHHMPYMASPAVPIECRQAGRGGAGEYGGDGGEYGGEGAYGSNTRFNVARSSRPSQHARSSKALCNIMQFYEGARQERERRPPGRPAEPQRVVIGFGA
ncbi:hypothetical protein TSOC_009214 [Tetrabaena socialis]|uniref:Uncharacterized protein n=1 Tax=Tetrabaena socialis TaxID=47790 RepID=A0A2J7ZWH5_9CHLO|nr:hypothetical protein TSOC_009214 [Tetrabaena socialis]|eukprot:PNH04602.1 hypothetical protein TSOC_009214 [Tetrabaena socialis]